MLLIGTTLAACILAAEALGAPAPTTAPSAPLKGPGVLFIDRDGDGYGVAAPNGADADDTDAKVNTPATAAASYPDIRDLLGRRGYKPSRVFYIAKGAAVDVGAVDDPNRPFGSFDVVRRQLRPGDAVLFRGGPYPGKYSLVCQGLAGTAERPILLMAYPGERAVLDATVESLSVKQCRYLILDGFILTNSETTLGKGLGMSFSRNITLRNIEATRHYWGWIGMQDLHDVLAEDCVFHDNPHEHGVYLGARDKPNSSLTIRRCLMYRNGRHGFQHNGRVDNLLLEDNAIHTNDLAGVSLVNGVCHSSIRGNLIFNNNKQGIVFYAYDDRTPGILPYDQIGNTVAGNTIWVGSESASGGHSPRGFAAIVFSDTTTANKVRMEQTLVEKNILVTQEGESVLFSRWRFATGTVLRNNLLYRAAGPGNVVTCEKQSFGFESLSAVNPENEGNRYGDPGFADVRDSYAPTPEKFDFTIAGPATGPAQ